MCGVVVCVCVCVCTDGHGWVGGWVCRRSHDCDLISLSIDDIIERYKTEDISAGVRLTEPLDVVSATYLLVPSAWSRV